MPWNKYFSLYFEIKTIISKIIARVWYIKCCFFRVYKGWCSPNGEVEKTKDLKPLMVDEMPIIISHTVISSPLMNTGLEGVLIAC